MTRAYLPLLLLTLVALPACEGESSPPSYAPTARLMVFSDTHYMDPALGPQGDAFDGYLARDRKLLAESAAILRSLLAAVEVENPNIVLVSGDLTKDGERSSHEAFAAALSTLKAQGRKVFVVPGNHDIQNGAAEAFDGQTATPVPAISAAEFAALYANAGYSDALARDPASLSYTADLVPGLRLLAIDSCVYGDTRGSSKTEGRIAAATRTWIAAQLDRAKKDGVRMLAMMHHGLVEHFDKQAAVFREFLVDDRDAVGALLANGGVGAVFTGHFHANDIAFGRPSGSSRGIYDIETGSAVTFPCPYRIVDVDSDTLSIATKHVEAIDYDLKGAPDFQSYAKASLTLGLETLITNLVQTPPYSMPPEDAAQCAPFLGAGLVAHYAGDEVMPEEAQGEVALLQLKPAFVMQLAASMLQSVYTDPAPADNVVVLDLTAR